jgi:putative ABC transport system ATP-binding protein
MRPALTPAAPPESIRVNERPEIVRLDQLVKIYSQAGADVAVHALRGITLTIRRGEYVAIIGASGSGKSTLMNILGCLDRPTAGKYWLAGQDVSTLDDDELSDFRGRSIGFIFQNFNLIQAQTVLENLEVPMFYQGVPVAERRQRAYAAAQRVGLADRLHHRPSQLSGGQQQRVAIARALLNDPVLLLADEPTGNLDSATGQLILAVLDELHRAGKTLVIVTHDRGVAARCQRVIEFRDGVVIHDGAPDAAGADVGRHDA